MPFDVIIPAHNNAATISRVLDALWRALAPGDRVIVVDDGSADSTRAVVERSRVPWQDRLLFLRQQQRGPAAARNAALKFAAADLLLFLGADILPDVQLLSRHRAVHRGFPEREVGCVGFVTWDPALPPTPLMVWLEHGGNQNAFGDIAGQTWVDPRSYCYGANLSLKRALLQDIGGFDDVRFPSYGWEDLDLGIRLARRGCRLAYEPTARAWHMHPQTFTSVIDRQRRLGSGAVMLERLHPDVLRFPPRSRGAFRTACYRLLLSFGAWRGFRLVAELCGQRFILPRLYGFLTSSVFKKSVQDARFGLQPVDNSSSVYLGSL